MYEGHQEFSLANAGKAEVDDSVRTLFLQTVRVRLESGSPGTDPGEPWRVLRAGSASGRRSHSGARPAAEDEDAESR